MRWRTDSSAEQRHASTPIIQSVLAWTRPAAELTSYLGHAALALVVISIWLFYQYVALAAAWNAIHAGMYLPAVASLTAFGVVFIVLGRVAALIAPWMDGDTL